MKSEILRLDGKNRGENMGEIITLITGSLIAWILWRYTGKGLKEKIKVTMLVTVITLIACVLLRVVALKSETDKNATDMVTQTVDTGVNINNTSIGGDVNIQNTEINNNITNNYGGGETLEDAYIYMRNGEYDKALLIFQNEEYSDNSAALINLGYLYENGLTYYGESQDLASEYYKKANCVEGLRNLFALYIKNGSVDNAEDILIQLLNSNDQKTIDYVESCLYGTEYYGMDISSAKASGIIAALVEWKETSDTLRTYNPPAETYGVKWIVEGINFKVAGNINHPTGVYKRYERLFMESLDMLVACYYETDDGLKVLDI